MARIVVGISGASGMVLAWRTLLALGELGFDIECVMTPSACYSAAHEMGKEFSSAHKLVLQLPKPVQDRVKIHNINDIGSCICSGSYKTAGMVVIPCSMASLAAISMGLSDNTLRRAADVTIKEGRPLVIVPREMPFSQIHLENMLHLTKVGAVILPPIPAWYAKPKSLEEMENFIVGRVLDHLKIEHSLYTEWN
jgi:4-hydroxy-3-polyprenylbenzoate decarboxylase